MELIIASHNQDKLNEFKKIIGNKIKLYSLYELGFNDEIPEREKTVEKNAVFKASLNRSGRSLENVSILYENSVVSSSYFILQ